MLSEIPQYDDFYEDLRIHSRGDFSPAEHLNRRESKDDSCYIVSQVQDIVWMHLSFEGLIVIIMNLTSVRVVPYRAGID